MLNNTFNIKKNIQFYLQATKTRPSALHANEGFTLVELLVATAIMSIVVTLAGFGVVFLLRQNKTAASESDRRINLNRALDYIANEVRTANSISATTTSTLPTGAIGKLRLAIPSDTAFPNHEYYIISTSTNCSTNNISTTLWACNNVIYRRLIPASGSPTDAILVDGVDSFTAPVTSSRQVVLTLVGTLPATLPGRSSTVTDSVSATAVTRAK
jgi:prepilin-type N-terminal cleavage/methylation domain-containing protein